MIAPHSPLARVSTCGDWRWGWAGTPPPADNKSSPVGGRRRADLGRAGVPISL